MGKKPVRIRVVMPLTGLSEATVASRKETLQRLKGPQTEVEIVVIREGPSSIESAYDEAYAARETLREVVRAEQEGADAAIIWCAGDANLVPARELVSMPVVGPAGASFHIAGMLADRFTVLTILSELKPWARRLVGSYGLEGRLASVRAIDIPVLELEKSEDRLLEKAVDESVKAIVEDGAAAIVLGCMGMIHLSDRLAVRLREKGFAVPVINPAFACLKVAEMLVEMRLSHSKVSYPLPRKVEGL